MKNKRLKFVILCFFAAAFLVTATAAANTTVPPTLRIDPSYNNISDLTGYDAVPQIGLNSTTWGLLTFEDSSIVPVGWRVWFLDDGTKPLGWDDGTEFLTGLQPMGVVDSTGSGQYNFVVGRALQGDKSGTNSTDEGATIGTFLTLVGQDLSDNSFYEAAFTSGGMMTGGFYQAVNERHDIMIDRTAPIAAIPEPTITAMICIGVGVVGWLRKRGVM